MHWIDWLLVVLPLIALLALALRTRKYVRGAADFIAGGRCAGRYVLTNAMGESGSGVTNTVSHFELMMVAGFVVMFWSKLSVPLALILGITGFCSYRYRETRALSAGQFYEMRYSHNFRRLMGILAFVAGVLNYGIFPAVSARFFIYFLDLPAHVDFGLFAMPTHVAFMAAYMTVSCTLVLFGGQVTLMVTDCVEGILSHGIYMVIIIALFCIVSWEQVLAVLVGLAPGGTPDNLAAAMQIKPGHSPVNPFDAFDTQDFNFTYVMLGMLGTVYGVMSWQGGHGFRSAARTPHEGRMAGVLGQWRTYARTLVLVVLVICTMAYLRHPDFAADSAVVKQKTLAVEVPPGDPDGKAYAANIHEVGSQKWMEDKKNVPQLQRQQITSISLRHLLPVGLAGLFLLVMVLGLFAGDGSHILSWSSIFVQDVVLTFRRDKTPLSPETHLKLLRLGVLAVAGFAFLFSWLVPLKVPIWMWWAITGAIYTAGSGAVIIGGLYWKRGTAAGAWTSMVLGSSLAVGAILLNYNWVALRDWALVSLPGLGHWMPERMWLNSQWHAVIVMFIAASTYAIVSLATCRKDFDMDWLLRRGKHRVAADHEGEVLAKRVPLMQRLIGIDKLFTRGDKWVAGFIFWWSLLLVVLNVGLVGWHYVIGNVWPHLQMSNHDWAVFWLWYGLLIPFAFAAVTLVWFGIGGLIDMKRFFHALKTMKRDDQDDGSVRAREVPAEPREEAQAVAEPRGTLSAGDRR